MSASAAMPVSYQVYPAAQRPDPGTARGRDAVQVSGHMKYVSMEAAVQHSVPEYGARVAKSS